MKIWIEKADVSPIILGGKSLFMRRLADEFRKRYDISVVSEGKADISLNVIGIKHNQSKKKILRLDGVWHDTRKLWRRKNKALKNSMNQADGVIYQSNFARRMCDIFLGEPKCPTKVIFNGSDPTVYDNVKSECFFNKPVFLACSKWRPHKRLRDIIESFLLANISNSALIVVGDIANSGISKKEMSNYVYHHNIFYHGKVHQNVLISILKSVTASIHLCWFDACPNSVVEAIVAGVPVICNNTGGTWEIVGPSGGIICTVDEPYNFKPVDLYNPPSINRDCIADALIRCSEDQIQITRDHVLIKNIADQYLSFIESLL